MLGSLFLIGMKSILGYDKKFSSQVIFVSGGFRKEDHVPNLIIHCLKAEWNAFSYEEIIATGHKQKSDKKILTTMLNFTSI